MSCAKNRRPFLAQYVAKYGMPTLDKRGRLRAVRVKTCKCPHVHRSASDQRWHDEVFHKPGAL